jgi:N-methylhydantoinase B
MHCAPWGILGGHAGLANQVTVRVDGKELENANAKVPNHRLKVGDALVLRAGGGGGFGSPVERDADLVARDVCEGYVTRAVANNVYRVVVDESGTLDAAATVTLRASTQES